MFCHFACACSVKEWKVTQSMGSSRIDVIVSHYFHLLKEIKLLCNSPNSLSCFFPSINPNASIQNNLNLNQSDFTV